MFDGLFGDITNTKLRLLCLEFAHHIISRFVSFQLYNLRNTYIIVFNRASSSKLQLMNPLLMTAFNKVIDMPESKEVSFIQLRSCDSVL